MKLEHAKEFIMAATKAIVAAEEAGQDEIDLSTVELPKEIQADDAARAELQSAIDKAEGNG